MDNGQTRAISGLSEQALFGCCSRDLLETAKKNLSDYFYFGITEYFDQSLIYFAHNLGWTEIPYYTSQNVGSKFKEQQTNNLFLREEILDRISYYNKLDIELYDWAKQEFKINLNYKFRSKVALLKVRNELKKNRIKFSSQLSSVFKK
jgi:hypothetical protein